MSTRPSVLPSQTYSPVDGAYAIDNHNEGIPSTRQPLGESTGNAQTHSLSAATLCQQGSLPLSSPVNSIPAPSILPTQTLPSTYGTSIRNGDPYQQHGLLPESQMAYTMGSKNPIYSYKNFSEYRNKVMVKEADKENPTWPLWLENAFLDGW